MALGTGQTVLVVSVCLTLAYGASDVWWGFWLGTATLIKPFLAPLWLVPLREQRWSVFLSGSLTIAGWIGLGSQVYTWAETRHWFAQLHRSLPWTDNPLNSSLATLMTPHDPATSPAWWLASVGILFTTAVVVWNLPRRDQWWLLTLAGLLASPLAWIYYWLLLLPVWRPSWPLLLVGLIGPWWLLKFSMPLYAVALLLAWIMEMLRARHPQKQPLQVSQGYAPVGIERIHLENP